MKTLWFWQNEIREGMKRRNDPHPVLKDRNRKRVKYAVKKLREGSYAV